MGFLSGRISFERFRIVSPEPAVPASDSNIDEQPPAIRFGPAPLSVAPAAMAGRDDPSQCGPGSLTPPPFTQS